jgi:hypothetical protein
MLVQEYYLSIVARAPWRAAWAIVSMFGLSPGHIDTHADAARREARHITFRIFDAIF